MPTLKYKHPTHDSAGNPMPGASRVTTRLLSPGGALVKEVFTDRNAGTEVVLPVPMTPEEAAAASGGTAESVTAAQNLAPSDAVITNAPAVVTPTKAGQALDFEYLNS